MRAWLNSGGPERVFNVFLVGWMAIFVVHLMIALSGWMSKPAAFFSLTASVLLLFATYLLDNYLWWKYVRGGGASWF